jgi:hypothetical protein
LEGTNLDGDILRRTEKETIIADAQSSKGKTPEQRMEMFADLLATVDAVWMHLSPEERRRRMWIADQIHRRPEPWWKNLRLEAQPVDATASLEID